MYNQTIKKLEREERDHFFLLFQKKQTGPWWLQDQIMQLTAFKKS